jgi:hypothetical protein
MPPVSEAFLLLCINALYKKMGLIYKITHF